jgi:ATP-dependent DNA helicase RecG
MNKEDAIELVRSGEGYTLELKERMNGDIGKTFCAFANASGGKVILGVKDDGDIVGFKPNNSDCSRIQDIARNMEPSLAVYVESIGNLVVVHVPEGKDKPYAINGHFYIRIGANSQQLKRDEIRTFFQKENQIFFDRKANSSFDMDSDFDDGKFARFVEKTKIPKELPREHILKNLNLLVQDKMSNAGVLFFCHRVTKFFMNSSVVCVLYKGNKRIDILDKKEFDADFLSNYENAYNYVLSKLNTNFIIKGRERTNVLELPEDALREAIINAMVHRDYFSQGRVQIDIFIDRVEVSNPGNLLFDKKELGKISLARNPVIMDMVYRLNLVENVGSGINRMKRLCSEQDIPIDFEIGSDWFRVLFHRKVPENITEEGGQKGGQKGGQVLTERQREILAVISETPNISRQDLAKKLGIYPSAVQKHIEKLKEKGMIERIGPDKGGYWEVSDSKEKIKKH